MGTVRMLFNFLLQSDDRFLCQYPQIEIHHEMCFLCAPQYEDDMIFMYVLIQMPKIRIILLSIEFLICFINYVVLRMKPRGLNAPITT